VVRRLYISMLKTVIQTKGFKYLLATNRLLSGRLVETLFMNMSLPLGRSVFQRSVAALVHVRLHGGRDGDYRCSVNVGHQASLTRVLPDKSRSELNFRLYIDCIINIARTVLCKILVIMNF